jgi:hypothetical protein
MYLFIEQKKAIIIRYYRKYRLIIVAIVLMVCTMSFTQISTPRNIPRNIPRSSSLLTGQILFSPMVSSVTYLIDRNGNITHTWPSGYFPGEAVYWLNDGTILRTIRVGVSPGNGGVGGGVQKIQWDGSITWDFRYNTNGYLSHHDIEPLPNGNILMIAWETKTSAEAVAAGRNPSTISGNTLMPDHIIEVRPTGPTSGDIVWEWHVWDHLIQDYDSSKENYGLVADHPELVDINYVTASAGLSSDWLHCNSVDYHEAFDQILISVHNFNEIWVIDHSTTTQQAAGHTGGNSGKGGDLLYRWGNPLAYQQGSSSDQQLFSQHDATWIAPGCPGAGNILIFNNGANRPGGSYSSVDEIVPPVNATGQYTREPESPYGPSSPLWSYTSDPLSSFYASYISGAQRLPDGNTLICDGPAGRFFEVTPGKETVWQYINPYPLLSLNNVFKICYVPAGTPQGSNLDCTGSLSWTNIHPGETVTGSFQVKNIGGPGSLLNWTVDVSSVDWGTWSFTPESDENLTPEDGFFTVQVSVVAPDQKNSRFEGFIRVVNQDDPNDFDVVPILLKTPMSLRQATAVFPLLRHLLSFFPFFSMIYRLFQ